MKQLVLKGIFNSEEWDSISSKIFFEFSKDNYFAELKDAEILTQRLNTLQLIDPYVGRYYSTRWVRKNVLKQTDEDIEEIDFDNEEAAAENAEKGLDAAGNPLMDPMDPGGAGGPPGGPGGGGDDAPAAPAPPPKPPEKKSKPKVKKSEPTSTKAKGSYKYITVQGKTKPYYRKVSKRS